MTVCGAEVSRYIVVDEFANDAEVSRRDSSVLNAVLMPVLTAVDNEENDADVAAVDDDEVEVVAYRIPDSDVKNDDEVAALVSVIVVETSTAVDSACVSVVSTIEDCSCVV